MALDLDAMARCEAAIKAANAGRKGQEPEKWCVFYNDPHLKLRYDVCMTRDELNRKCAQLHEAFGRKPRVQRGW